MRDYNPKRYRARSSDDRGENTERMLTAAIKERDRARAELDALRDTLEVMDKAVRNLTTQLEVAQEQQHRYRIAFMLFAQNMRPNFQWAELWAMWLMRASEHMKGTQ